MGCGSLEHGHHHLSVMPLSPDLEGTRLSVVSLGQHCPLGGGGQEARTVLGSGFAVFSTWLFSVKARVPLRATRLLLRGDER